MRVNRLLLGNTDVWGCSFGVLALDPARLEGAVARLGELIAAGSLRPVVGATYPLEDAGLALRDLDERRATGKLVITL